MDFTEPQMDKDVVHTYNAILLNHKKKWKEGSIGVGEWAVQITGDKIGYKDVLYNREYS